MGRTYVTNARTRPGADTPGARPSASSRIALAYYACGARKVVAAGQAA
jgi:hypothetical protein